MEYEMKMSFGLDGGMHDVVIALVRATQTSGRLCRSFIPNERESQKTPQNVWLKPYLAQLLTCRISREVECVALILFPFQTVLSGDLQLQPHSGLRVASVLQKRDTTSLNLPPLAQNVSIKTHLSEE